MTTTIRTGRYAIGTVAQHKVECGATAQQQKVSHPRTTSYHSCRTGETRYGSSASERRNNEEEQQQEKERVYKVNQ
jgi:hypothetical protein